MAYHSEVRMNSIDQQQPEETCDHLQGQQAIDRIREMAKDSESCFFCTALSLSETGATRPTSEQAAYERGPSWFLSPSDSAKNRELQQNAAVCSARCRPIRPPAAAG